MFNYIYRQKLHNYPREKVEFQVTEFLVQLSCKSVILYLKSGYGGVHSNEMRSFTLCLMARRHLPTLSCSN